MNEIILEVSAFLITCFCLTVSLREKKPVYLPMPKRFVDKLRDQHSVFLMLLIVLIISCFSSVLCVVGMEFGTRANQTVLYILNEIYFLFHNILSFLAVLYVMDVVVGTKTRPDRFFLLFLIPLFAGEILVVANPFSRMVFYFDEYNVYHRGSMMWLVYLVAAFYIAVGFVELMKNRKNLPVTDRHALFLLAVIAVMGVVLQAIWSVTVELFFEAVVFLGFMELAEDRRKNYRRTDSKKNDFRVVLVIVLTFFTVISANVILIYNMMTTQTKQIGDVQIDNIKGDLQEMISETQSEVLKFGLGLEKRIGQDSSKEDLEEYIRREKEAKSNDTCINVYAACSKWSIIPDFDMPDDYHATERIWYLGAKEHSGEVYITEPYVDAYTGSLCITASTLLSDNDTVVAMDFNLAGIRRSIAQMNNKQEQIAMIVTEGGTIVGHSDMELAGRQLSEALPDYVAVFERVIASNEHDSFPVTIGGRRQVVFSNETENHWYLILCEDYNTLYRDSYNQIIMMAAMDIMMVVIIIVFYMISAKNREKVEVTLEATESFLENISTGLREPLTRILRLSDLGLMDEGENITDLLGRIRGETLRLSEMLENLFSYGEIVKQKSRTSSEDKSEKKRDSRYSVRARNRVVAVMVISFLLGMVICVFTSVNWGNAKMEQQLERYDHEFSQWITRQQAILEMYSDMISVQPEMLDDYDFAVKWLDQMAESNREISICYIANPYKEHTVIMNTGWEPEEGWQVEERRWYRDTERSLKGYSISAPYVDQQTGEYCMTFSKTVYGTDGKFLGIFGIDFFMDQMTDALHESYAEDSYAFFTDSQGVILNHPDEAYQMSSDHTTSIEDTAYAEAYHSKQIVTLKDFDGRLVSCYSKEDESSHYTILVVNSWWSVYGSAILIALMYLVILFMCVTTIVLLINHLIRLQKESNAKLVEAARQAVSAGNAKSQFLAQMSHEIRTPINAVLGMNEMILRESEDKEIVEYAGNIKTAGRTLLSLINSILDFSKIEDGKMEIVPVQYETALLVGNLVNSILQRAKDKNLVFRTEIDRLLPSVMYGDDVRLTQVIMNLLTNAVKYTEKGCVTLRIVREEIREDEVSVYVEVKDTGIGIKPEDQGKLFETFTRLEEDRNRTIEGTGLGMAIVTRLLDMMGSKLNMESEYGKGSVFSFSVKQRVIDDSPMGNYEDKIRRQSQAGSDQVGVYAPGASILVVDDNEMNLKVASNLLKRNGIVPDMVTSGYEAIVAMGKKTYDLVLLDHMMPNMDGVETLRKLREKDLIPEGTAIIALTANAVLGARDHYLEKGFDEYLSKPIEVARLEEILKTFLPEELLQDSKEEGSEGKAAADKAGADKGMLARLRQGGFTTEEALEFCMGDESFYREVLLDFANEAPERCALLEQLIEQEDWQEYQIRVHGLKSTARTIGAAQLSAMALQLEEAAKNRKGEFIKVHNPHLTEMLEDVAVVIRRALA
ncbi:MAG: response regulator [Lachnospiraceae bacterium]|nr:response regulator [Lachnospiraceae bacterium]